MWPMPGIFSGPAAVNARGFNPAQTSPGGFPRLPVANDRPERRGAEHVEQQERPTGVHSRRTVDQVYFLIHLGRAAQIIQDRHVSNPSLASHG